MVLLSLLFISYIHNLIPFFQIHDLITVPKNYTAKIFVYRIKAARNEF